MNCSLSPMGRKSGIGSKIYQFLRLLLLRSPLLGVHSVWSGQCSVVPRTMLRLFTLRLCILNSATIITTQVWEHCVVRMILECVERRSTRHLSRQEQVMRSDDALFYPILGGVSWLSSLSGIEEEYSWDPSSPTHRWSSHSHLLRRLSVPLHAMQCNRIDETTCAVVHDVQCLYLILLHALMALTLTPRSLEVPMQGISVARGFFHCSSAELAIPTPPPLPPIPIPVSVSADLPKSKSGGETGGGSGGKSGVIKEGGVVDTDSIWSHIRSPFSAIFGEKMHVGGTHLRILYETTCRERWQLITNYVTYIADDGTLLSQYVPHVVRVQGAMHN